MNEIQQAAQAAATQAANAAAQAQSSSDSGNGGIPQAASIMGEGSQTSNDVQAMLDAQPLPQNGEDVPTAQNGMLYDGIVAPDNNSEAPKSAATFSDAREMLLQSMQDIDNSVLNSTPKTIPDATMNDVPIDIHIDNNEPPIDSGQALNTYFNNEPSEFNYGHNSGFEPHMSENQMPNLDDIKQVIADAISANLATASQTAEVEPEISEPEFDVTSDEFYNKFSNNPGEAIMEVATHIAQRQIAANKAEFESRQHELEEKMQPFLEESERVRQRNASVDAMKQFLTKGEGRYNDFSEYSPQIAQIMRAEQMDFSDPRSFETAYLMAKLPIMQQHLQAAEAQRGKSLADYLSEEASINEIVQNPTVKQQVINSYLRSLQNGSSPQVITNGANSPVGTVPTTAKSFKEARNFFESALSNNL